MHVAHVHVQAVAVEQVYIYMCVCVCVCVCTHELTSIIKSMGQFVTNDDTHGSILEVPERVCKSNAWSFILINSTVQFIVVLSLKDYRSI